MVWRIEQAEQDGADGEDLYWAQRELYRGQCNCSYWHGAFGGLYLPHLRNAIFKHLISADSLLEKINHRDNNWLEVEAADFNLDARKEIRLASHRLVSFLSPAHGGHLYELDGLQEGPIDLGEITEGEDWLSKVSPIIQQRMLKYNTGEIHFNLMALVSDKKMQLQKQIDELTKSGNANETTLLGLREALAEEESKRAKWQVENIRRRHNYLPLIVNMLKMLAEQDKLMPLYQVAKQKALSRKATASKQS